MARYCFYFCGSREALARDVLDPALPLAGKGEKEETESSGTKKEEGSEPLSLFQEADDDETPSCSPEDTEANGKDSQSGAEAREDIPSLSLHRASISSSSPSLKLKEKRDHDPAQDTEETTAAQFSREEVVEENGEKDEQASISLLLANKCETGEEADKERQNKEDKERDSQGSEAGREEQEEEVPGEEKERETDDFEEHKRRARRLRERVKSFIRAQKELRKERQRRSSLTSQTPSPRSSEDSPLLDKREGNADVADNAQSLWGREEEKESTLSSFSSQERLTTTSKIESSAGHVVSSEQDERTLLSFGKADNCAGSGAKAEERRSSLLERDEERKPRPEQQRSLILSLERGEATEMARRERPRSISLDIQLLIRNRKEEEVEDLRGDAEEEKDLQEEEDATEREKAAAREESKDTYSAVSFASSSVSTEEGTRGEGLSNCAVDFTEHKERAKELRDRVKSFIRVQQALKRERKRRQTVGGPSPPKLVRRYSSDELLGSSRGLSNSRWPLETIKTIESKKDDNVTAASIEGEARVEEEEELKREERTSHTAVLCSLSSKSPAPVATVEEDKALPSSLVSKLSSSASTASADSNGDRAEDTSRESFNHNGEERGCLRRSVKDGLQGEELRMHSPVLDKERAKKELSLVGQTA